MVSVVVPTAETTVATTAGTGGAEAPGPGPGRLPLMSKPTGAICNLDCEYCFFLPTDQLYPGSGFRMEPHARCLQ